MSGAGSKAVKSTFVAYRTASMRLAFSELNSMAVELNSMVLALNKVT